MLVEPQARHAPAATMAGRRSTLPPSAPRSPVTSEPTRYAKLLADIKARIQAAQTRAVLAVNAELIRLYWGIGRLLDERQAAEGCGAGVIPRLANDLRNELPELKGFSSPNLDRMLAFARAYPEPGEFSPQAVANTLGRALNRSDAGQATFHTLVLPGGRCRQL